VPPDPGDPLLGPGLELDGYVLGSLIGVGGMGVVYAASHPERGEALALKTLRADLAGDGARVERFEREIGALRRVTHRAIGTVLDAGHLTDGRPYLVMPSLGGRSLRTELDERGRIPPREAWRIVRELALGLRAAHEVGVLHRDIKPENVLLVAREGELRRPVLIDFGLAKLEPQTADDAETIAKLTATGAPIGTPRYMAPEQWWGTAPTEATDQYALGGVLFELLAGRPPFEGTRYPELCEAHLHQTPPSLPSLGVECSAEVDELVLRMLAKEPSERHSSLEAFVEAGDASFGFAGEGASPSLAVSSTHSALAEPSRDPPSPLRASSPRLHAAAAFALALGALFTLGYPGSIGRDPRLWMHSIGLGSYVLLASALVALTLLPRIAARLSKHPSYGPLALALVLAPVAFALLPTLSGWRRVTEATRGLGADAAFQILHVGYYEVTVTRFLGLGLTVGLALALAVLLIHPIDRAPVHTSPPTTRAFVLVTALVALLGALGIALAYLDASEASVFAEALERGERIALLLRADTVRNWLLQLSPIAALLGLVAVWKLRALRPERASVSTKRHTGPALGVAFAGLALLAGTDTYVQRDFALRREASVAALSEQLSLFAKLSPPAAPRGHALSAPVPAALTRARAPSGRRAPQARAQQLALEDELLRQPVEEAVEELLVGVRLGVPADAPTDMSS
jgi:serine/threonine protein kinase